MNEVLKASIISIYGEENASKQIARYENAINEFTKNFGKENYEIFSAPGRIEICGNQVDHNDGIVLSAAIDKDTIAVCAPTDDKIIKIISEGFEPFEVDLDLIAGVSIESGTSSSLVRGIATAIKNKGYTVGGFCAYITSDVASGSGLSSSAAFEVVIGTAINHFYCGARLTSTDIAKVGQYAENTFFGKPSGLMDQLTSATGGLILTDFERPAVPKIHKIVYNFDNADIDICVIDTKSSHADLTEDYADVPREMKKVAGFFSCETLRGTTKEAVLSNIPSLRDFYGDRAVLRAIHYFEENERAIAASNALIAKDLPTFLDAINKSGQSSSELLQNLYSTKAPQNQALVIANYLCKNLLSGEGAVRVHGGGFAGTVLCFIPKSITRTVCEKLKAVFGEDSISLLKIRKQGAIKL